MNQASLSKQTDVSLKMNTPKGNAGPTLGKAIDEWMGGKRMKETKKEEIKTKGKGGRKDNEVLPKIYYMKFSF